jgi:hypothetical protein
MGSSMVTLYIEIFSTMVHAPTHVLSGMLPEVSNPLFIRKKFDKLIVVTGIFISPCVSISQRLEELLINPNLMGLKNT